MATVGEAPTRAGRYTRQPTGYRAFMPALLPPQPALAMGGELQGLLSAEAQLFEPTLPRDVDEVIDYVHAMNRSLARLAELPVSMRLIHEFHAELMRGVLGSRCCICRTTSSSTARRTTSTCRRCATRGPGKRGSRSSCAA